MTLIMGRSSAPASHTRREYAAEIARPLQHPKKCRYCNYEQFDDFDLKFHEEMYKQYYEQNRIGQQERREYETFGKPMTALVLHSRIPQARSSNWELLKE
jgi:hypothetical protein